MATVYVVNNKNELEEFRKVNWELEFEHKDHLFSVKHKKAWIRKDINELKDKNAGSDVFSIQSYYKTDPHWHFSAEERLILSGAGRFFIPTTDKMYVVDVEPGDLIWLSPCLQHWFETYGIMAARFFEQDTAHVEQKDNLSIETLEWSDRYRNNFKPDL